MILFINGFDKKKILNVLVCKLIEEFVLID